MYATYCSIEWCINVCAVTSRAGVRERLEDTQHERDRTTQQLNATKQELESLRDIVDKLRCAVA